MLRRTQHLVSRQCRILPGLPGTPPVATGPELADSQQVIASGYLGWFGEDGLSQLDRRFERGP